jgi:hypothetical protein
VGHGGARDPGLSVAASRPRNQRGARSFFDRPARSVPPDSATPSRVLRALGFTTSPAPRAFSLSRRVTGHARAAAAEVGSGRRPADSGGKPQELSSIVNHETLDGKIAGTGRQGAAASRIPSLAAPALPPR